MRVCFLTTYFPPEVGAAQTRTYDLAVRLARMGHEVSVVTTFPNYPTGIVPPEWRGKLYLKTRDDGFDVYRLWSYTVPNRGFLKRIISHFSFAAIASLASPFLPKADVIIVESHPLFNGFAGIFLSVLKRAPYVFNVSDLWPESAIQLGILKNRTLIRVAKAMELLFYRRAKQILAMTEGIRTAIIDDGIDQRKVLLFRNGVDCGFFRPVTEMGSCRERFGIPAEHFVVLYAGNLGLVAGVRIIAETASLFQLEAMERVHFVVAGDGAERETLLSSAREFQLKNLTVMNPVPKERMPELVNAADCMLVPLRDLKLTRGTLPTKMFEAMSCGKPVVLAGDGEAANLICESGAGLCVKPENAPAIHDAIVRILSDPEGVKLMGMRGREYVMQHFDRNLRAQQLHACLVAVVGR